MDKSRDQIRDVRWLLAPVQFPKPGHAVNEILERIRRSKWVWMIGILYTAVTVAMQLTGTLTTLTAYVGGSCILVALIFFAIAIRFLLSLLTYHRSLRARVDFVQMMAATSAGWDSNAPAKDAPFEILHATRKNGRLQLYIRRQGGDGLQMGSRLSLVSTPADIFCGSSTVVSLDNDVAVLEDCDRFLTDTWDHFESVADKDATSLKGYHFQIELPSWFWRR